MELGTSYADNREWYQAVQVLKECYQHCKKLIKNLQSDEELLHKYPIVNTSNLQVAELSLLTKVEREKLSKALIEDYKVLANRLMRVGEQLSEISLEQITKWTAHLYSTSWRSRHHNLIGIIDFIRDRIPNHNVISTELDNISSLISQWSKEDSEFLKFSTFYIVKETYSIINTAFYLQKYALNLSIENIIGDELQIHFSIEVLRIIIENLMLNTYEAAIKFNIEWLAKIEYKIINNYITILFSDNVGDFDNYSNIINCINIFESPKSSKGESHGNGLILIKKLIRDFGTHNKCWELKKCGPWKTLYIPLIKYTKSRND